MNDSKYIKTKNPLKRFFHDSRSIGLVLLICTAISLCISNFELIASNYFTFWNFSFSGLPADHIDFIGLHLPNSPLLIVNDAFMALFFFLAGMEIKRELLEGELATRKQAIFPVLCAIGGMIVPALFYALFNKGTTYQNGWAIPTATDIAFTLGIAALLGKRIPIGLKIFLTALAIIDDLGAIIVIAFFYGAKIQIINLLIAILLVGVLFLMNFKKLKFGLIQILLGIILWYFIYNSGIHATVAGVIFAFLIPVSNLKLFETKLHIPVYFIIIPIFALANTAIPLNNNGNIFSDSNLSWGVILGLCIGKPLGICGFCYLLVKRKWANLPAGVNFYKMIGAGILAGIGFTMSIFISTLAFDNTGIQNHAKISVLLASLFSMLLGYCWFRFESKKTTNLMESLS